MVGDLPSDFLSLDSQPGQGQGQSQASTPPISNNYPQDGASAPLATPPAAAQRTAPVWFLIVLLIIFNTSIRISTMETNRDVILVKITIG